MSACMGMSRSIGTAGARAAYTGAVALAAAALGAGALASVAAAHASAGEAARPAPAHITMVARPAARRGPDGQMHDVYTHTALKATVGQRVIVTVYNYDTARHSFVAPDLRLTHVMPGTTRAGVPTKTTFSFTATKAGTYQWLCAMPCDDWSMAHASYMAGTITVARA